MTKLDQEFVNYIINRINSLQVRNDDIDVICNATLAMFREVERLESLGSHLELSIEKLKETLKSSYQTLTYVSSHAPGYDWNADPLSMTLKIGEVFREIETLTQDDQSGGEG